MYNKNKNHYYIHGSLMETCLEAGFPRERMCPLLMLPLECNSESTPPREVQLYDTPHCIRAIANADIFEGKAVLREVVIEFAAVRINGRR